MSTIGKRRRPRLGHRLAVTLMTSKEFDSIRQAKDNYRHERIHGMLVVSPLPLPREIVPNELRGHRLLTYKETHPEGGVLDATLTERHGFLPDSRRRADRLIWCGLGRLPNVELDRPSIAVEFVSQARRARLRDHEGKRAEYRSLGIPEYWVFDRFRKGVAIFRFDGTELFVPQSQPLHSPLLPGFKLDLAPIFALSGGYEKARRR